jgi:hypothetical protein
MQQLLGWNIYLCVFVILAVTALYTVVGKYSSCRFTNPHKMTESQREMLAQLEVHSLAS